MGRGRITVIALSATCGAWSVACGFEWTWYASANEAHPETTSSAPGLCGKGILQETGCVEQPKVRVDDGNSLPEGSPSQDSPPCSVSVQGHFILTGVREKGSAPAYA